LLASIAFHIDFTGIAMEMLYYYMFVSIFFYFPATVDSLVTILMLRDYREAAADIFRHIFAVTMKVTLTFSLVVV
jgi:hypothetical protein